MQNLKIYSIHNLFKKSLRQIHFTNLKKKNLGEWVIVLVEKRGERKLLMINNL